MLLRINVRPVPAEICSPSQLPPDFGYSLTNIESLRVAFLTNCAAIRLPIAFLHRPIKEFMVCIV